MGAEGALHTRALRSRAGGSPAAPSCPNLRSPRSGWVGELPTALSARRTWNLAQGRRLLVGESGVSGPTLVPFGVATLVVAEKSAETFSVLYRVRRIGDLHWGTPGRIFGQDGVHDGSRGRKGAGPCLLERVAALLVSCDRAPRVGPDGGWLPVAGRSTVYSAAHLARRSLRRAESQVM
jgi:hypothetical protein